MARRLSSPVFVGRSDELRMLLSTADAVASGETWFTLIGGEAGVGKSRLVAEASANLDARGWLVLEGGCIALGEEGLPFGPIVEALGTLVRDVPAERIVAAAGPSLPELARLVPEFAGVASEGPLPAASQSEWLQTRIFSGILGLLGRLGETSPVLLVVEDLHWADRATRDLLGFLARNRRDERLLVVTTFRSDELHRRHPLSGWLAEAERQQRMERLDLARFERAELVQLLAAIAAAPPDDAMVDSIARRSDGNAFFAEELVAAAGENGTSRERLPVTLRGVVLQRLSGTSNDARRLVEIAAVAGRQVEHAVLAAVCGMSEDELRAALHDLVDAQILVVANDPAADRYRFRHALVQEAAYEELLPSERRILHAAYARAIEARSVGGGAARASRLVELAHHWTEARDTARALAAAIDAADASRAVYAYGEAARQYERAIDLWDVVSKEERPADRDVADLYDAASAAATLVGDASHAVALARRGLELVEGADGPGVDRERLAQARERLGHASWLAGDTATSIRLLEEAVASLEGSQPTTDQARILAGLAANLMLAGRARESVRFAERAIESARAIGAQAIESRAMNILGVDRANLGDIGGGIELLRRSLALADPTDDATAIPRAYANLGSVLEMGGYVEEALEVSLAGAESIRHFGNEVSFRIFLEVNAAAMLIELGRYADAAELLEQNVPRVLPGISTIHLHLTMSHLAVRTGDLTSARHALDIARSEASSIADAQFVIDLHAFGTEIALWAGDATTALRTAREGFDRVADMDDAVILGQLAIPAMHAAADLALRAWASRDHVRADEAIAAARHVLARYEASTARLTEPDELASREIGWRMAICGAELARGRDEDDPARWAAIRPALAARPAPFMEAYVLWRQAEALAGTGATAAAAEPLREAHAIATGIGAGLLTTRIERFGRRVRIDLPAPVSAQTLDAAVPSESPAPPDSPARPAEPFGLTAREREVLELIAAGYTNRRIAETLFISPSTAGVHVSNLLGKVGASSRTEAAAIAVRLGLDRTTPP